MEPVLKVGALIDSLAPAAWVAKVLQDVNTHALMQLTVAVDNPSHPATSASKKASSGLAHWLIYSAIDSPNFSHNPWEATTLCNQISQTSLQQNPDVFEHCDLIVCLTHKHPATALSRAGIPVWSVALPLLDHGIQCSLLNRAPFIWVHLWELQFQSGANTRVGECIASHTLPCQTYSISDLRRLSYSALPQIFMSRLGWLANKPQHKLDSLSTQNKNQGVFEEDIKRAENDAHYMKNLDQDTTKSTSPSLALAVKLLIRKSFERMHHKLFTEHWQLAFIKSTNGNGHTVQQIANTPVHEFTSVAEPDDVLWADPHLIEHEEHLYAFFERMHSHNQPAHIAFAKLDSNGKIIESGKALQTDHHLSFPYVFQHNGEHYMIPETSSQQKVCLYRATRFPDKWEAQSVLLDGINAADTVLLHQEGLWWMFTNFQSHRSVDERDELHLYYSEQLSGPYKAHSLNPVITGVDRSRMAGPILEENGTLYRSSQYGAWRYGYGLNISRIDELTPTSYRESPISRLLPDKKSGWVGCHSLSRLGDFTVIDRVRHSRR